jgi:hypothetical protein
MSRPPEKLTINKKNYLKPFTLLGPPPGKCSECAITHEPKMPHDARSLFYQYNFYAKNGRWPTWNDAMSHCDEITKKATKTTLTKLYRKV